ncbi:MAG: hypothetical protein HWE34_07755 [Methylocystaceae bacterium]|nr:hypothetical protein [Methylocystaceae bacterium]
MKNNFVVIRLPEEKTDDFTQIWEELRIATGYSVNDKLPKPEQTEGFDALTLTEWLIPLYEHSSTLISAILGYLIARKGEVQIGKYKFKNMSATDIEKILKIIKENEN